MVRQGETAVVEFGLLLSVLPDVGSVPARTAGMMNGMLTRHGVAPALLLALLGAVSCTWELDSPAGEEPLEARAVVPSGWHPLDSVSVEVERLPGYRWVLRPAVRGGEGVLWAVTAVVDGKPSAPALLGLKAEDINALALVAEAAGPGGHVLGVRVMPARTGLTLPEAFTPMTGSVEVSAERWVSAESLTGPQDSLRLVVGDTLSFRVALVPEDASVVRWSYFGTGGVSVEGDGPQVCVAALLPSKGEIRVGTDSLSVSVPYVVTLPSPAEPAVEEETGNGAGTALPESSPEENPVQTVEVPVNAPEISQELPPEVPSEDIREQGPAVEEGPAEEPPVETPSEESVETPLEIPSEEPTGDPVAEDPAGEGGTPVQEETQSPVEEQTPAEPEAPPVVVPEEPAPETPPAPEEPPVVEEPVAEEPASEDPVVEEPVVVAPVLPEFVFSGKGAYAGDAVQLSVGPSGVLPEGVDVYAEAFVGGEGKGSVMVSAEGAVLSVGGLPVGEHAVTVRVSGGGAEPREGTVSVAVAERPVLSSLSFWFGRTSVCCWADVRDASGAPFVAHRMSSGVLTLGLSVDGEFESSSAQLGGGVASIRNGAAKTQMDIVPQGLGRTDLVVAFSYGVSVHEVRIPYVVYEEYVFRPAESHSGMIIVTNDLDVGWETVPVNGVSKTRADVTWSVELAMRSRDGSRMRRSFGPYRDNGKYVGDGTRVLRSFKNEFKDMRSTYLKSHKMSDAEAVEGTMSFSVSFVSRYHVASSVGMTFGDVSGVVEASAVTPSADPLLGFFSEKSGKFFRLKK